MPQGNPGCKIHGKSALILQPGQIGAHRAANQYVLGKVHGEPIRRKQLLQQCLKANRFGAERKNGLRNLSGFIDIVLCQRCNVLGGLRMGRHKPCGGKLLNLFQRVQIGAYVIDNANLILLQGLLTG